MVVVAQLVRALVCGAGCRGFESHLPPIEMKSSEQSELFLWNKFNQARLKINL